MAEEDYTVSELAKAARISRQAVLKKINDGEIKAYRDRWKRYRIQYAFARQWLADRPK